MSEHIGNLWNRWNSLEIEESVEMCAFHMDRGPRGLPGSTQSKRMHRRSTFGQGRDRRRGTVSQPPIPAGRESVQLLIICAPYEFLWNYWRCMKSVELLRFVAERRIHGNVCASHGMPATGPPRICTMETDAPA